jgi:hypothetical protein
VNAWYDDGAVERVGDGVGLACSVSEDEAVASGEAVRVAVGAVAGRLGGGVAVVGADDEWADEGPEPDVPGVDVACPCGRRLAGPPDWPSPGVVAPVVDVTLCSCSATCCWLRAVTVSFPWTAPRTTPTAASPTTVATVVTTTQPVT